MGSVLRSGLKSQWHAKNKLKTYQIKRKPTKEYPTNPNCEEILQK